MFEKKMDGGSAKLFFLEMGRRDHGTSWIFAYRCSYFPSQWWTTTLERVNRTFSTHSGTLIMVCKAVQIHNELSFGQEGRAHTAISKNPICSQVFGHLSRCAGTRAQFDRRRAKVLLWHCLRTLVHLRGLSNGTGAKWHRDSGFLPQFRNMPIPCGLGLLHRRKWTPTIKPRSTPLSAAIGSHSPMTPKECREWMARKWNEMKSPLSTFPDWYMPKKASVYALLPNCFQRGSRLGCVCVCVEVGGNLSGRAFGDDE